MYATNSVLIHQNQTRFHATLKGIAEKLFATALMMVIVLLGSFAPSGLHAQVSNPIKPLVVGNDRGGLLDTRLHQLRQLRESGQPVMITGSVCFSTCTMLIGLPQTCVSPRTTFGFHGPSSYGRKLSPQRFEWASQVIAQYYPPALKQWYVTTGRHRTSGVYRISGSELIRMGIRQC